MSQRFYDIFVAKDYETQTNGAGEKKTVWYKVGTAWKAKASESLNLELYLFPGQRYLINMKNKDENKAELVSFEEAPF